jgi:hypothetical protein
MGRDYNVVICGFRLQPEGCGCRQSMDRLSHPSG